MSRWLVGCSILGLLLVGCGSGVPAASVTATLELAPDGWPVGRVSDVEVAGMYSAGFEGGALIPCPGSVPGPSGPLAVPLPSGRDAFEQGLAAAFPPDQRRNGAIPPVYVRVVGELSPYRRVSSSGSGGYGNGGAFSREIAIRYAPVIMPNGTCPP